MVGTIMDPDEALSALTPKSSIGFIINHDVSLPSGFPHPPPDETTEEDIGLILLGLAASAASSSAPFRHAFSPSDVIYDLAVSAAHSASRKRREGTPTLRRVDKKRKLSGGDDKRVKMSLVDWRWAASKGFWDSANRCWNEAMGGMEGYLKERENMKRSRQSRKASARPLEEAEAGDEAAGDVGGGNEQVLDA